MGLCQVGESYENDGNFTQISLVDKQKGGDVLRLENFRCSHPYDEHFVLDSNRIFRMIYSTGNASQILSRLEMRGLYDEDGSYICTICDLNGNDPAFGTALVFTATPVDQAIIVNYKIVVPGPVRKQYIYSPNTIPIQEQAKGLVDLAKLATQWASTVHDKCSLWCKSVVYYLHMGDFRDKRIHNGTNLTGDHTLLASEFVPLSNYRVLPITIGKIYDSAMADGAHETNI
ncbi:hypothetical protein PSPO01_05263 [Paraphaeosphaeria sporulosa]